MVFQVCVRAQQQGATYFVRVQAEVTAGMQKDGFVCTQRYFIPPTCNMEDDEAHYMMSDQPFGGALRSGEWWTNLPEPTRDIYVALVTGWVDKCRTMVAARLAQPVSPPPPSVQPAPPAPTPSQHAPTPSQHINPAYLIRETRPLRVIPTSMLRGDAAASAHDAARRAPSLSEQPPPAPNSSERVQSERAQPVAS